MTLLTDKFMSSSIWSAQNLPIKVYWLLSNMFYFISRWTKWPPFRRRYFQMHFREKKVLYFYHNWKLPNIGLDNGMAPNRLQAFYVIQCWLDSLIHICGTGGRWVNYQWFRACFRLSVDIIEKPNAIWQSLWCLLCFRNVGIEGKIFTQHMRIASEDMIVQRSSQTFKDIGTPPLPYFAEMETNVLFYNY